MTTNGSLDVEACVRLLTHFAAQEEARAEFMDEQARKILRLNTAYTVDRERENATEHRAQAAQLGALITFLRSALPGMGKDSQRLDWLNGRLNWFTTQGPGHDPQYRDIRERIDAAQTMTPEYVAARAAQPQETSADA